MPSNGPLIAWPPRSGDESAVPSELVPGLLALVPNAPPPIIDMEEWPPRADAALASARQVTMHKMEIGLMAVLLTWHDPHLELGAARDLTMHDRAIISDIGDSITYAFGKLFVVSSAPCLSRSDLPAHVMRIHKLC